MKSKRMQIAAIIIAALFLVLVIGGVLMLRTGKYLDDTDPGTYVALNGGHYRIVPVEFHNTFTEKSELLIEAVDEMGPDEDLPDHELPNAMLAAFPLSGMAIIEEIWKESSDLWELDEINVLIEGCSPENSSPYLVNMTFTKVAPENGREVRYQTTLEYDYLDGYIHWGTAKISGSKLPLETVPIRNVSMFTQMLIDVHSNGGYEFEDKVGGVCTTQALSGGSEWQFYYWDNAGDREPFYITLDGESGTILDTP